MSWSGKGVDCADLLDPNPVAPTQLVFCNQSPRKFTVLGDLKLSSRYLLIAPVPDDSIIRFLYPHFFFLRQNLKLVFFFFFHDILQSGLGRNWIWLHGSNRLVPLVAKGLWIFLSRKYSRVTLFSLLFAADGTFHLPSSPRPVLYILYITCGERKKNRRNISRYIHRWHSATRPFFTHADVSSIRVFCKVTARNVAYIFF